MIRVVLKDIVEKPITGEWGDEGTSVNVLRTTNFTNEGFIDYTKVVKRDIEQKKIDAKRLHRGDIIIEKSGGSPTQPVGRVVYFDSEEIYLCNNFTAILRPKKEQVFPKYLQYILFVGHQFGLTSAFQNKTTGIINLQLPKYLEGIQIPLPPLPQQQKIANILDAADALRQNDKVLIAKYDELTQALFLDMFGDPVSNPKGWEKVSGKKVFKLVGGAAFKSTDYTIIGLPLIRIGTVNKGYFDSAQLTFLPKSFEESHSRYIVYPNDLLITLTGTVGKDDYGNAFALTYEYEKYLLNQRVAKICNSDSYNLVFLKFFLKQKKVKNELIGVSRGVRQANLSNEDFYKLEVISPPLNIQNQFAERVALIEEQKCVAQASLAKSEELFNSLLQKAFKGELV